MAGSLMTAAARARGVAAAARRFRAQRRLPVPAPATIAATSTGCSLTASGGPFRETPRETRSRASRVEDALAPSDVEDGREDHDRLRRRS